ncbi:MAG: 50S ribosomal protein L13 [Chloroflexia bacterium]|nr:50S ribosomal protein L13 [Chloroflexia bacterium]
MSVRTFMPKVSEIERQWFVVDAEGQTLGRIATKIATLVRGKHKPTYTPHLDVGDYVIVINAEKVRLTGRKEEQKNYYRHSNYPGGLTTTSFRSMIEKHPERVIEFAVKGMLPGSTLAKQQLLKLKVYAGPNHPHAAQQPTTLEL